MEDWLPDADTAVVPRIVMATLAALFVVLATAGGAEARSSVSRSWAAPQIAAVVDAGLMAPTVGEFRPDDPLTWSELSIVVASLGGIPPVKAPDRLVTVRELDAQLVSLVGLRSAARGIRVAALVVGLSPRPWLGTETVARMLGLRLNHDRGHELLELQLGQPATRAEAAFSIARVLALDATTVETVRAAVTEFTPPMFDRWQRTILSRALRFVGSPYVWAGTSERPQRLSGRLVPGGFDCSGLVWRVFKLEPFAGAPRLAGMLKGRTTYAMSAEVAPPARVRWDELQPGDLVFFGARGERSRPAEVGHMGIYFGEGWMLHSSRFGTTLVPMTGWFETSFAWGRRLLAEAGLDAANGAPVLANRAMP